MHTFARSASILLVLRRVPLLEIVHSIVHIPLNAIVNNKVILRQPSRDDRLVLILRDLVVERRIRFALERRVVFNIRRYDFRSGDVTFHWRFPPSRVRLSSASAAKREFRDMMRA